MNSIESTPEYKLHLATLKMRDNLYKKLFGDVKIHRYEHEENFILDREFHIDVKITHGNDSAMLGQEKILSPGFANFNTFTIEFYQNRRTKEHGEFFHIASQYYLHGYASSDLKTIDKYIFLDMLQFINWLRSKPVTDLEKTTRPTGGSRASFYYINYKEIPKKFILYSHNTGHVKEKLKVNHPLSKWLK